MRETVSKKKTTESDGDSGELRKETLNVNLFPKHILHAYTCMYTDIHTYTIHTCIHTPKRKKMRRKNIYTYSIDTISFPNSFGLKRNHTLSSNIESVPFAPSIMVTGRLFCITNCVRE